MKINIIKHIVLFLSMCFTVLAQAEVSVTSNLKKCKVNRLHVMDELVLEENLSNFQKYKFATNSITIEQGLFKSCNKLVKLIERIKESTFKN
ncbi:MAG: hypothetical protein HOO06_00020 [Bdellovibrionaceae bacterium]|nr:hypothetical protein [Pseudobdellovibrionaceae bacterium]